MRAVRRREGGRSADYTFVCRAAPASDRRRNATQITLPKPVTCLPQFPLSSPSPNTSPPIPQSCLLTALFVTKTKPPTTPQMTKKETHRFFPQRRILPSPPRPLRGDRR